VRRLAESTLSHVPGEIARPDYDRRAINTGIVHLGIGAFHRAHQAVIFDQALRTGDHRWGIVGASLRSPTVRDQMIPQEGLYSVVVRDGAHDSIRIVGAVRDVLVAPDDPARLVEALAHPAVHLATLTVTEKGYKLDPATGSLIEDDPDVAADLLSLTAPRTTAGFLVAALACRRAAGIPPFTALSCDNLPDNGPRLRDAVLAIAGRHDPHLRDWIAEEVAFPQSMVDRIVPATDEDDIAALSTRLGVQDRAMVKTEPFLQWVIEDRFCSSRPAFETLGVQLTHSVAPWEEAKLRLLNGAHSGIAYLGGLAGLDFVDQFVALPAACSFVETLWDEAVETLSPPAELDITGYRAALMQRFANPALQHRTRQIAMDGSQKLPQRLLAPIANRLERGQNVDKLALAVAAWMRWQGGRDDNDQPFIVDDPLAAVTAARLRGLNSAEEQVAALLSIDAIFPPALAMRADFRQILTQHLVSLTQRGALATIGT